MMSDGSGEVSMEKLSEGQGRTKRVGVLVIISIEKFSIRRPVSVSVAVVKVKFLSQEDAERIQAR